MHHLMSRQVRTRRVAAKHRAEGSWWRAARYEIFQGCIRPVPGADLEWYDPWEQLARAQEKTGAQPPYIELARFGKGIQYRPGPRRYPGCLTDDSQQAILRWCERYGLLGVLLSCWESINLAPVRDRSGEWHQVRYFHAWGDTVQQITETGDVKHEKPLVRLHDLNDVALNEEPPEKTWGRFFPTVPPSRRNSFQYPPPDTDDFCERYAEPLIEFVKAATLFAAAMEYLQLPARGPQSEIATDQALAFINVLRRPISRVLDLEYGRFHQRSIAPSLLAGLADMAVQDVAFGRYELRKCARSDCEAMFVSTAYQSLYCSRECRIVQQKRNLRVRVRHVKNLRRSGKKLHEIAKLTGENVRTIKAWLAAPPTSASGQRG